MRGVKLSLEQKHLCNECGKDFKEQKNLEQHCKATGHKHNIEKEIECSNCNKKFKSIKDLKQHQEAKHSKIENQADSDSAKKKIDFTKLKESPLLKNKAVDKGKMNESEARFKEWLDHQVYNFYFLDQTTPTQSEQFKTIASRPDFLIKLADNKHIYVDVKEKQLYTETETFTFYKETQERLATFEERFNIPVWIAMSTRPEAFRVWHFISLNKITKKGELHKDKDGIEFFTIDLKKCFTFGWKDTLNKIVSKVDKVKKIQSKFTNDLMKKLEEHDTELKKIKRQRREDKKKLQNEIDEIKANYLVKPSVKLKQFQEEVTELVSENVKKMKEGLKKTFKKKSDND